MKNLVLLANITLSGTPERKPIDGVEHLVFPAIAIKEGVLNNVFYPASEIESFHTSWNGVPVPVNHPTVHGNPVTANSTDIEDTLNIGKFYNVKYEDSSIKGEVWVNIEKAERLGFTDVIQQLESGEMMEISTGLHAFTREEKGVYNGQTYDYVIDSIRPDHLALLPDTVGACSIKDGCGAMRLNKDGNPAAVTNCAGGEHCTCPGKDPVKTNDTAPKKTWAQRLRAIFGLNASASLEDRSSAVYRAVHEAHGKDAYPYIVQTYDGYTIFELGPSLYRQDYTFTEGKATLVGSRIEVKSKVEYVPVTNQKPNQDTMDPKTRPALVNALALALVANDSKALTDEHTASVNALPDPILANMAKQYQLNEDGTPVNVEPIKEPAKKAEPKTPSGDTLTNEDRELLESLKAEKAQRLEGKRQALANARKDLTPDTIATFNESAVDALLGDTPAGPTNYAGQAPAAQVQNQSDKPYRPEPNILAPYVAS